MATSDGWVSQPNLGTHYFLEGHRLSICGSVAAPLDAPRGGDEGRCAACADKVQPQEAPKPARARRGKS